MRLIATVLVVALVGCAGSDDPETNDRPEEAAADGYSIETLVDGLEGPTQIAWHPDGRLLVAVLGEGGEGSDSGQVLAVESVGPVATDGGPPAGPEVLVSGLDTPTGLAVIDDTIWIMERTRLVSAPLAGGAVTVVRDDLPSNGRSNGSLTVTSEGRLLYNTSGRQEGTRAADGSGVLWSLDPLDPASEDQPVMTGMKHAYATAEDGQGGLLVTEIGDGTYDGERPPDEVVVIPQLQERDVADGGWPRCIGDREPVAENDGSPEWCARAVPSLALFEPGATPTGVAPAPWDPNRAVVALWVTGALVEIPTTRPAGDAPVASTPIATGLDGPQHLLADGDRLLLSVHGEGEVLTLNRSAPGD